MPNRSLGGRLHGLGAAGRAALAATGLLVCAGLAAAQPVPTATLSVPSETVLGQPLVFTATFDNTSPTSTRYGPYLDLVLPATGADGAGDQTDDGITFVGASYKGVSV